MCTGGMEGGLKGKGVYNCLHFLFCRLPCNGRFYTSSVFIKCFFYFRLRVK